MNGYQKLKRKWIGIDITHLAITLIKSRLYTSEGPRIEKAYQVVGEPVDLESARQLAEDDKFQFQVWALGLVGARPLEAKKGADKGIDGRIYFSASSVDTSAQMALISVKGGHVTVSQIRDLRGVIERDNAAIGVFICLEPATGPMRREAADAEFYERTRVEKYPRLQILTIEELLSGKRIEMPQWAAEDSFKKAPKVKRKSDTTPKRLGFDD